MTISELIAMLEKLDKEATETGLDDPNYNLSRTLVVNLPTLLNALRVVEAAKALEDFRQNNNGNGYDHHWSCPTTHLTGLDCECGWDNIRGELYAALSLIEE